MEERTDDGIDLVQVAQHADDLDRASEFYEALLGAPPVARFDPPGLVFFVVGNVRLLLNQAAPPSTIYLRTSDLRARIEQLRAGGVTIVSEPHAIFTPETDALGPAGHTELQAFIRDSEGNTVGLVGFEPVA